MGVLPVTSVSSGTFEDASCDIVASLVLHILSSVVLLLIILLVILLLAAAPAWPYSRGWGYYPSGGIGTVLLILIVLLLLGAIHF
jgi:low affinity Fe/Cu permease